MRVLYFTRDYTPHDHRFLTALAGTEHEVFFLRLERLNARLEERRLPEGIHPIAWQGGQKSFRWADAPGLVRDLKRVIDEVQPDLIHAGPIQTAAWLASRTGFHPLVSMSWGSDLLCDADKNDRWKKLTRATLDRSDVLVGDCRAVQEKAATFGFPPERTVLFPWGVDLEQFSPGPGGDLRRRLGWEDCLVLLSLRSWEPVYGVDVVARAFVWAARQDPDLRLILLGAGSQETLIRSILEAGQVMDRVHLGGQVSYDGLPEIYRTADVYLSASHSDGSSVSLMEALASGKPVIVSDIPGNLEWIVPEENGWLFPDGDVDALTEKILAASRHRERFQKIGRTNRAQAERRADWPANFQHLLYAYQLARSLRASHSAPSKK